MTRNRRVLFAAGVLLVSLFAAVSLRAAEEGGNAATERATEIFKWINFAIVAGLIVRQEASVGFPGKSGSRQLSDH